MYIDVLDFHEKFGLPMSEKPVPIYLHPDGEARVAYLKEEMREYLDAAARHDVAGELDALIDLVYVAIGNAVACNLPWDNAWDAVHDANMAKVPAPGDPRRVKKPEGWKAPDLRELLEDA